MLKPWLKPLFVGICVGESNHSRVSEFGGANGFRPSVWRLCLGALPCEALCQGKGADPGKKVTMGVGFEDYGVDMDAGAEHSAASFTVQLRTEFLNTANLPPSDWRVMFLTSALAAMAVVVRQDRLGAKVLIDESLQDRWEPGSNP